MFALVDRFADRIVHRHNPKPLTQSVDDASMYNQSRKSFAPLLEVGTHQSNGRILWQQRQRRQKAI
jgi:hypothetical protein